MKDWIHSWTIYAHRGMWESVDNQNTLDSCLLAKKHDFGVELDVRSNFGNLYLSHDQDKSRTTNLFSEVMNLRVPIAINLKEDGLLKRISKMSNLMKVPGTFVFDGSLPEMVQARKMGISHALRISEYEEKLPWDPDFVWLDSFESDWWVNSESIFDMFAKQNVVVVSPELHGRESGEVWHYLKSITKSKNLKIGICTDEPMRFYEYLSE